MGTPDEEEGEEMRNPVFFTVKREVLGEILKDEKCVQRIRKAETFSDIASAVEDYCREKGYKVNTVKLNK